MKGSWFLRGREVCMSRTPMSLNKAAQLFFTVDGTKCQKCTGRIEKALQKRSDLLSVSCDPATKKLVVTPRSKVSLTLSDEIISTVKDLGFGCQEDHQSYVSQNQLLWPRWLLGGLGVGLGLILMLLSLTGISLPLSAMISIAVVSVTLTAVMGTEFYWNALKSFFQSGELNMNSLFTLSTLAVIGVSVASFFVPGLPMVFNASLMILGFRHLGLAIQGTISHSLVSGKQYQDMVPSRANVWKNNELVETLLRDINIGDEIELRPGDVVPVNGICLSSEGSIYTTIKDGYREPRAAVKRQPLLAGMCLASGSKPIRLQVTQLAKDSYLARFDAQIAAANQKPQIQTIAKKALQYFIPAVLLASIVSFGVLTLFFPPATAIQCAIAVLVSACPCTLGMIIPLAVRIGANKALKHGVEFKSKKVLEEVGELAAKLDTVVFDLHGTLTQGKPCVTDYQLLSSSSMDKKDFFEYLAILESNNSHPVAKSVINFAVKKGKLDLSILQSVFKTITHAGVFAKINNAEYALGSQKLMTNLGIKLPKISKDLKAGESLVYLAKNKQVLGVLFIEDPLRKDAKDVVKYIQKQGKTVCLCTGADEKTAHKYAKELNIASINIRAAQHFSDSDKTHPKLAYIQELKTSGHIVAMVGDGPNDAPAIAASDIGIAVATGDDLGHKITQEQASAVIQSGALKPVLSALTVARQTVSNAKQNLLISFGYNFFALFVAGGFLIALGFTIHPAVGAALMVMQSTLILLNAYRFKQKGMPSLAAEESSFDGRLGQGSTQRIYENSPGLKPSKSYKKDDGQSLHNSGSTIALFQPHKQEESRGENEKVINHVVSGISAQL